LDQDTPSRSPGGLSRRPRPASPARPAGPA
jgi:hypothetical protein